VIQEEIQVMILETEIIQETEVKEEMTIKTKFLKLFLIGFEI
jgi:hypothetical protein